MLPIIELFEQFGYNQSYRCIDKIDDDQSSLLRLKGSHIRTVKRMRKDEMCLKIDCNEHKIEFQTSYFVGVDWIVENQLSVYVQPKLNKDTAEINYIKMLLDAIQEPENIKHLDELVYIDFHKPAIQINQSQDILSPFLIAQYLQLLKLIVRKGLKKSYYTVTENMNAKVKGKILIGANIKQNTVIGRHTHTICQYQEFGVNCDENKILKRAYQLSRNVIQQYKSVIDIQPVTELINYIHPAFEQVTENIDINKVKQYKPNPIYKEYQQAIKLAILILKRFSYNITKTEDNQVNTPPFWIDMSKLFELYTFSKLRKVFPHSGEVMYHIGAVQNQELDFLIKSNDEKYIFVVDTKYKPQYENGMVKVEDIRQVSGYARIKSVYKKLGYNDYNHLLKCLIIYSHQICDDHLTKDHFDLGSENDIKQLREEKGYAEFYKLGIKLPEMQTKQAL
jgi:5-methylcytosine-specific restriction enzyme subunit McrC